MKKIISLVAIVILVLNSYGQTGSIMKVTCISRPPTGTINRNYASNRAPLLPQSFIKLPVGAIKPQGWILKLLQLQ